jgi:CubicO group peptidase (beta-lactamase class C family)
MKKLIALVLIGLSATAMAQHRPHYHHHGGHGSWGWVAPALISGAVVYAATRPPVVVQQPPVVVQQPTDIVYIDGVAYRKQIMLVNGYYQEVLVRI